MAGTEAGINPPWTRKSRRVLPRQACDSCRHRKTRCEQVANPRDQDRDSIGPKGTEIETGTRTRTGTETGTETGTRTGTEETEESGGPDGGARSCKRCTRLGLECTTLLPVRARGPQPRNKPNKAPKPSRSATPDARNEAFPSPPISGHWRASPAGSHSQLASPQAQQRQLPATAFPWLHSPISHQPWAASPHSSGLYEQLEANAYPTDIICGRKLLQDILNDYFEFLYPMVPIVHKPSFLRDFSNQRDLYDKDLVGLICALCAVTVAVLPSKFQKYQQAEQPPSYASPKEMIHACYNTILRLRGQDYFEEINYQKWATSHLMFLSFFHITQHNRARMIEVEAMQLARLLDLHKVSGYDGLNCIEKQLRKKAFWLTFYGYVHQQLQFLRKERLTFFNDDEAHHLNLEAFMPEEVDDEYILENAVLAQPPGRLSLVVGFNINSRLFRAALTSTAVPHARGEPCHCSQAEDPNLQIQQLKDRLCEVRYMLDGIPAQMRPWAALEEDGICAPASEYEERRVVYGQFASMRANLHTSQLWLQSLLLDQLDAHVEANIERGSAFLPSTDSGHNSKSDWKEREDICRQLLHLLHSIPDIYLEPNGHVLVSKIRDVAICLLLCPKDLDEGAQRRAAAYLQDFSMILSKLEGSDCVGTLHLQSWVDTDRRYRL